MSSVTDTELQAKILASKSANLTQSDLTNSSINNVANDPEHLHGPTKPFVSKGYLAHKAITYGFFDWIANATVGVSSTYLAERTVLGQKIFGTPVSNFFQKVLTPVLKTPGAIAEGAMWGKSFASIMVGGFVIMPFISALENKANKKKIIRAIDEKCYGKDEVANNPKFQDLYERVDKEPNKSFWNGMGARLIAIAPLITLAVIPKTNNQMIKYIYDPIGRTTQWAASKVGIKPLSTLASEGTALLSEGALAFTKGEPAVTRQLSNWDFLHRNIGFDFGLTVFYAKLHELAYNALSRRSCNKKHSQAEIADEKRILVKHENESIEVSEPETTRKSHLNYIQPRGSYRTAVETSKSMNSQMAIQ